MAKASYYCVLETRVKPPIGFLCIGFFPLLNHKFLPKLKTILQAFKTKYKTDNLHKHSRFLKWKFSEFHCQNFASSPKKKHIYIYIYISTCKFHLQNFFASSHTSQKILYITKKINFFYFKFSFFFLYIFENWDLTLAIDLLINLEWWYHRTRLFLWISRDFSLENG